MSVNIGGLMKSIRNIMREDTGLNGDAQRIEQLGWMIFINPINPPKRYYKPLPSIKTVGFG